MADRLSPEACHTMASLRGVIDAIDDELFDLFAERMACIHRAAELKRREGLPANVPSRVEEVVRNAERRAGEKGLDPKLYGDIWRAIVDAAIAEEERRLGSGKLEDQMAKTDFSAALACLASGDWNEAHRIVQDDPSPEAAWIHAHLHRIVGDVDNAAYWYRRAGRPVENDDLGPVDIVLEP